MPRPLEFVWLELTHRCNLRCAQCYTHSAPGRPLDTLPTARWRALLDEVAALRARTVQFTGGEPTEHPELDGLMAHAVDRGLAVELYTNATGLDAARLDRMAGLGVELATSLHSHVPEVHDAITRVPGSWRATVDAIAGAVARGLEVRVAAVLMAANADHGPPLERFVRGLGVLGRFHTDVVRPTGRGRGAPKPEPAAGCEACPAGTLVGLHAPAGGPAPPTCWDGKLAITPRGEVHPCIFSRDLKVGNVAATPLPRVLAEGPLAALWALSVDDVEICRDCDRKHACFDCRALPLSVLGDVRARSPRCDYLPPAHRPRRARPDAVGRPAAHVEAPCGDEVLVLDPERARLHRLDPFEHAVLAHLGAGGTVTALAGAAVAADGTLTVAAADEAVAGAADALWEAGLLVDGAGADVEGTVAVPAVTRCRAPTAAAGPLAVPFQEPARAPVELGGVRVRLEISEAAWPVLGPWRAPVATAAGDEAHHVVCVTTRRSAPHLRPLHHVLVDGERAAAVRTPAALRSALEEALCRLGGEAPGLLRVHGAAVSGPAGAAVIPGVSGAGKSLLALHAVAAGLGYLSDELALLELAGPPRVRPFAKPLTLKGPGRPLAPPALLAGRLDDDPEDPDGYAWLPLPSASEAPLAAVVLPDRGGRMAAPLERLAPGDAAEALLAQAVNLGRHVPGPLLARLAEVVEAVPCWRLDTRDLPAAAARLAALLAA